MPAHLFRTFRTPFQTNGMSSRMRSVFAPRKPRNALLRVVFGLIGIGMLAVLLVFGLFVGAAMLGAGLLVRLWRSRGTPVRPIAAEARAADIRVVEGEYRVVSKPVLPLPR